MNIKLLIFTLMVLGFTACQPEVTREVIRETPPANQSNRPEGTVDDAGGGSGVNNRNLERYAFKLLKNDLFKTHILPIIETLHRTHPRFASDMIHIAIERKWYMLDVRLNKLPAEVIGVSFQDETLQQMALQNLRAVWIDSKIFNADPSDEVRASLLLHEIIMGVRLMQFKSGLDKCLSEHAYNALAANGDSNNAEAAKEYRALRDQCSSSFIFDQSDSVIPGYSNKITLSRDDYDNIRELVINLEDTKGNISKIELDAWLKDRNFRKY